MYPSSHNTPTIIIPSTTNPRSKVCGSGLDCGRVSMGGIAMVSVAQNHYEPFYDLVVGQMFVKNSKQKLWLFVLYLFDPKFLKMAPGTHNAATNQINRSHCVDRTRWWGNAGGIHMRKISYIAGVVAVLVLVGVGTWIGVGKGTSTSAFASSAVNPIGMMTSATDLRTSHYDDYSVVFVELQTKR